MCVLVRVYAANKTLIDTQGYQANLSHRTSYIFGYNVERAAFSYNYLHVYDLSVKINENNAYII